MALSMGEVQKIHAVWRHGTAYTAAQNEAHYELRRAEEGERRQYDYCYTARKKRPHFQRAGPFEQGVVQATLNFRKYKYRKDP